MRKKGEDLILLTKASIEYVDIQLKIQWVNRIFTDVKYVDPGKSKAAYLSMIKDEKKGSNVVYFGTWFPTGSNARKARSHSVP